MVETIPIGPVVYTRQTKKITNTNHYILFIIRNYSHSDTNYKAL